MIKFRMLGVLALAAILAATYAFCLGLLRAIGSSDRAIAWAMTLAALSSGPVTLCRSVGNLTLSTVAFGATVLVGAVALRRADLDSPPADRLSWLARGAMVVTSGLIVSAAFGGYWWDEHNCHNGLVASMARGIAPPVHPLFPSEPFRYHYGFDALAAVVRAFTGAGVDRAIDVATLACWFALLGMAQSIGTRLAGSVGRNLAVFVVPFGGGLLSLLFWTDAGPFEFRSSVIPAAWMAQASPPLVIANFFQHPQGLGMPLSLAALALLTDAHLGPGRWVLGGVLLGIVSLAQIVFFAVLGLSLTAAFAARFIARGERAPAAEAAAALATAGVVAYALGGMLEDVQAVAPALELSKPFFQGSLFDRAGLHLAHFGVPFALTLWAVVTLTRRPTLDRSEPGARRGYCRRRCARKQRGRF